MCLSYHSLGDDEVKHLTEALILFSCNIYVLYDLLRQRIIYMLKYNSLSMNAFQNKEINPSCISQCKYKLVTIVQFVSRKTRKHGFLFHNVNQM